MQTNELNANLMAAHLVGHIEYYYKKAIKSGDKDTALLHLDALIRACELNPSASHWLEKYKTELKKYE